MRKRKIIAAALCGVVFSACGNSSEKMQETEPEIAEMAEVSETAKTTPKTVEITENLSEKPEIKAEISEATPEKPEFRAEMVNEITSYSDKIQISAEEYINSLMNSGEFLEAALDMELRRLHLADLDGDGLPEIIVDIMMFANGYETNTRHHIFTVSPETKIAGKASPDTEYAELFENFLADTDNSDFAYATRKVSWCRTEDILKGVLSELTKMYISHVPDIYSEIHDTVIYDDGKNTLTAGEYIDALIEYPDMIRAHHYQIADIDGNGIPELAVYIGAFPYTSYIAVSPEGNAEMLYDDDGNTEIAADFPVPYDSDGETVWVTDFSQGGSGAGGGYRCFLSIEDNTVKTEIISSYDYGRTAMFEYQYSYYWGSDQSLPLSSEEEYESRFNELLAGMENSSAAYVQHTRDAYDYDFQEFLSYMLREYLEKS